MDEKKLREQLAATLSGHGAHVPFEKAVEGFPEEAAGAGRRGFRIRRGRCSPTSGSVSGTSWSS